MVQRREYFNQLRASSLIHQYMQLVLEAKNLEMQEHCLIYEQITCNVNNRRQPVADAENLSHFR